MLDTWPVVGREALVDRCGALLGRPGVDGVVLSGATGTGKTRLLQECADRAVAAGFTVPRVTAHRSGQAIPFATLSMLLPAGVALVEDGVPLVRQAADALAAIADGRPLVLAVDDGHLLDEASALVLHQVAAQQVAFVIVAVAEGEPAPDAVTGLWRDGRAERLEVTDFDPATTALVLEAGLEGPVATAAAGELHAASGGNAHVLREVVRGSIDDGSLAFDGGLWRLIGAPRPSVRMRELVLAQVAGLDETARTLLERLALAEPLPLSLLETPLDDVERLEQDGVVAVDPATDLVALAHPMHSEVLRAELPVLRARRLRLELADRLEAAHPDGADVLRTSALRIDGGATVPAAQLEDAARRAYFANDVVLAERLIRLALDQEATFSRGQLLRELLYRTAREDEASAFVPTRGDDEERALAGMHEAIAAFWGYGDRAAADARLASCRAELSTASWREEVDALEATLAVNAGEPIAALALLEGLQEVEPRTQLQAGLARSLALPHLALGRAGVEAAERGAAVYAAVGDLGLMFQPGFFGVAGSTSLMTLGRLDESSALGEATGEAARATRDESEEAFAAFALGRTLLVQGRVRSSLRWMREAVALFSAMHHRGPLRWALGGVAIAAAQAGDPVVAKEALADLEALGPHDARMLDPDILRAEAWAALAGGDPEAARGRLGDAATLARATSLVVLEAHALHDLARLDRAAGTVARLAELAVAAEGEWLPALALDAEALTSDDADALAASADRFEALGALLVAAESATRAAAAYARAGRQREAATIRRRAEDLAARCEGATTPGLAQGDGPVPLTAREREIAVLAASGMASKAIAERLFLSARTVDNNLARVYVKLGVADRSALPEALGVRRSEVE